MPYDFTGRTAMVTGGACGIGRAISMTLAQGGAMVIIADINKASAEKTVRQMAPGTAVAVQTDISSEASIQQLFAFTMEKFGKIDLVVNNAGIFKATPLLETSAAEWDAIMAVNLRGTFLMCREALPLMQRQGSGKIINIASTAGKTGGTMAGVHYAASKAAVICLTKTLARYAAQYKINVNAVSPGPTVTDLTNAWGDELNTDLAAAIPWKEYGQPQDVADAVAFLASSQARYITGEILDVNGGFVMD